MGKSSANKKEKIYQKILRGEQEKIASLKALDIVIGIPFSDQIETLPTVIKTVQEGLQKYLPEKKAAVVIAATHEGKHYSEQINTLFKKITIPGHFFFLEKELSGKGWALRALMELSASSGPDLLLIEPDFVRQGQQGIQPSWIYSLYRPLELGNDFVLPVYTRPPEGKRVSDHLVIPLLVALYGYRIKEPMGSAYGMGGGILHTFLRDTDLFANTDIGRYGIDIFLTITAIVHDMRICQANLGTRLKHPSRGEFAVRLRQTLRTIFEQIEYTSQWWLKEGRFTKAEPPFYGDLPVFAPPTVDLDISSELERFRVDFQRNAEYLYKKLLHPSLYERLLELSYTPVESFSFSSADWARCVYTLLLAYFFQKKIPQEDILDTVTILNRARTATFMKEVQQFESDAKGLVSDRLREEQIKDFSLLRETFAEHWNDNNLLYIAPVERVLLEFLPGIPLNLPREVLDTHGNAIRVAEVYAGLTAELQKKGARFLPEGEPIELMEQYLGKTNENLKAVLGGTTHSAQGVQKLAHNIFEYLPQARTACLFLSPKKITEFLRAHTPYHLFGVVGSRDLNAALKKYEPRDIFILASFIEGKEFNQSLERWVNDAQADWFSLQEKGFIVQDNKQFAQWAHTRGEPSDTEMLCGKIVITQYPKAAGLEYPYLFYLSLIAKLNVELEMFSDDVKSFLTEKNVSWKIRNLLRRYQTREILSAHEIFEANVDELSMTRIGKSKELRAALKGLLEVYHVIYRLNGDVLSLGFPSWSIYRSWGRKGIPSIGFLGEKSKVEHRWFARELILRLAQIIGLGDKRSLNEKLREMRGNGHEAKNIIVELGILPTLRFDREHLPSILSVPEKSADIAQVNDTINVLIKSFSSKPSLEDLIANVPKALRPPEEQIEEMRRLAHELKGLEITHFNSAQYGGGVAEILDWLVPLMNSVGLKAQWVVINPQNPQKFFPVTKTFHNALQGMETSLTQEMKDIYTRESEYIYKQLSKGSQVRGDVLVCHDPQPLAAISSADKKKIWRAHIDLSYPNKAFVDFLLPFIKKYNAAIFHFQDFVLDKLKGEIPIYLIPAGINFLSPKNIELPPGFCPYVFKSFGIDMTKPIILQISRFDRFKDPKGVVDAFESARRELVRENLDVQLVYAGNMAGDDPEGAQILSKLIKTLGAHEQPPIKKKKFIPESVVWTVGDPPSIFIINLGAMPITENALVVNAMQRGATIVLQKSLREGLGLTILEAMCKKKPVIAGNIGGPAHLIKEDGLYGYGVGHRDAKGNLTYTAEETAGEILRCFETPLETLKMSERAQRHVGTNYSAIRHLLDYLKLVHDLVR
ncbi:MAG: glycosyltransferase [Deltaproteobacteria bacterium]|nr:glycosyltransferase [Deltaproteobacteria bacterium]